ncbi:DUF421 domain-containing protein [Ornithinimicrobium panacihumi]|uniref:DUF421 domain-containing protein n=1 Tax=Ornithinimicrobium panacihumi TaxID=2008449 RepID=UPI003F8B2E99
MEELWHYVGITGPGAVGVVISTVVIYFVFGAVLRLWGQRLWSSPRSLDLAVVTVLGAIVGRSTMGHVPTLAGGLLALGTLAMLELVFRGLRRLPLPRLRKPSSSGRAMVLAVDGKVRNDALARSGLTLPMLWSALRQAGVSHPSQTSLVVLEPNGRISVLRAGQPVHPRALLGVRGAHTVQQQLREAGLLHTDAATFVPPDAPPVTSGGGSSAPTPAADGVGGDPGQHQDGPAQHGADR